MFMTFNDKKIQIPLFYQLAYCLSQIIVHFEKLNINVI